MKNIGRKLLAEGILFLLIEWWIGTITYIANRHNIIGLAWVALAGMLVFSCLALISKKVHLTGVILVELLSVLCWAVLLHYFGYVTLFHASLLALLTAVILSSYYAGENKKE